MHLTYTHSQILPVFSQDFSEFLIFLWDRGIDFVLSNFTSSLYHKNEGNFQIHLVYYNFKDTLVC